MPKLYDKDDPNQVVDAQAPYNAAAAESIGDDPSPAAVHGRVVRLETNAHHNATKKDTARLEGKIDTVNSDLSGKIDAVNADLSGKIDEAKAELKGEIKAAKAESKADSARVEGKVETVDAKLSGEIETAKADIKGTIQTNQTANTAEFEKVRSEAKAESQRNTFRFRFMYAWMGLTTVMMLAMLAKLYPGLGEFFANVFNFVVKLFSIF